MKIKWFTLVETLIVVLLFGTITTTMYTTYNTLNETRSDVSERQTLINESTKVFETMNSLWNDFVLDYEEYFNRSLIWCNGDTADADFWTWWDNCNKFTSYGNGNSVYNSEYWKHKLYVCSTKVSNTKTDEYPHTYEYDKNIFWCYNNWAQAFWQYNWNFYDVMEDVDNNDIYVNDWDEDFLGKWPVAIKNNTWVNELYLISLDGTQRTYFRKNCDKDGHCALQMLKLRWFDAGVNHNFDWQWLYDWQIDTWACDYGLGFACNWVSIDSDNKNGFENYKLPKTADDGWVDLTSKDVDVKDWNLEIYPIKDPALALDESENNMVPYVKITLSLANTDAVYTEGDTSSFLSTSSSFSFGRDHYLGKGLEDECDSIPLVCPVNVEKTFVDSDGDTYNELYVTSENLNKYNIKITWEDGIYDNISWKGGNPNSFNLSGKTEHSIPAFLGTTTTQYFEISNQKVRDFCPNVQTKKCGLYGAIEEGNGGDGGIGWLYEMKQENCNTSDPNFVLMTDIFVNKCIKYDNNSPTCSKWSNSATPIAWSNKLWTRYREWIDLFPFAGKDGEWCDTSLNNGLCDATTTTINGCFMTCKEWMYYDTTSSSCKDVVSCDNVEVYTELLAWNPTGSVKFIISKDKNLAQSNLSNYYEYSISNKNEITQADFKPADYKFTLNNSSIDFGKTITTLENNIVSEIKNDVTMLKFNLADTKYILSYGANTPKTQTCSNTASMCWVLSTSPTPECDSTKYKCKIGDPINTNGNTWECTNAISEIVECAVPVDGVCKSDPEIYTYSNKPNLKKLNAVCEQDAASLIDLTFNAQKYTWECPWLNGWKNTSCSMDSLCGSTYGECIADSTQIWFWECQLGNRSENCINTPIDGVCGDVEFSSNGRFIIPESLCKKGSPHYSIYDNNTNNVHTWECLWDNGWKNASCSIDILCGSIPGECLGNSSIDGDIDIMKEKSSWSCTDGDVTQNCNHSCDYYKAWNTDTQSCGSPCDSDEAKCAIGWTLTPPHSIYEWKSIYTFTCGGITCENTCPDNYVWDGSACEEIMSTPCGDSANTCKQGRRYWSYSYRIPNWDKWNCKVLENTSTCLVCDSGYQLNDTKDWCVREQTAISKCWTADFTCDEWIVSSELRFFDKNTWSCNIYDSDANFIDSKECLNCRDGYQKSSDGKECELVSIGWENIWCFVSWTDILLSDGSLKKIENIKVWDTLIWENGSINEVQSLIPTKLWNRNLFSINWSDYFVTDSHPFKTLEWWKSINPKEWLKENPNLLLTKLEIWDTIIMNNGLKYVFSIWNKSFDKSTKLYNFTVSWNSTYYANWMLVHNKLECPIPMPSNMWKSTNWACYEEDGCSCYSSSDCNRFWSGYSCYNNMCIKEGLHRACY